MKPFTIVFVIALLHIMAFNDFTLANDSKQKNYIVHVDKSTMPVMFTDHVQWYDATLKAVSKSAKMLYTYNEAMHGFSVGLTSEEAKSLERQVGVISVQKEKMYQLHTTRTPLFLGLGTPERIIPGPKLVSNVIIGLLDTGIWPESKSFDDSGLGPVPSHWKGACEEGTEFTLANCNRKLIGARSFSEGYEAQRGPVEKARDYNSPRDAEGHGTHTSSTAAGSPINNVSLFGYANGTARGIATGARVAMYKVCGAFGCVESDMLAGFDKAIEDGVDILSISIGHTNPIPYEYDSLATSAFSAMTKGIFVSLSAGNGGPFSNTMSNFAPWQTIVGAGSLDRDFPGNVTLGDGNKYVGMSLHSGEPPSASFVPVVYACNVSKPLDCFCTNGTLIPEKVAGKIVICDAKYSLAYVGVVVREAGGVGTIYRNTYRPQGKELLGYPDLLPTVTVVPSDGDAILEYVLSEKNPTASLSWGATRVNVQPSPKVTAFSSRGPHPFTPGLLKPDILAPGLNIIAAWSPKDSVTGLKEDTRHVDYSIISGTSMSCPHLAGVGALIKAAFPTWTPAMIRSAIMTTAYNKYTNGNPLETNDGISKIATPFDYGAGHVDPKKALNPGLVYDNDVEDYLAFLCAANYTSDKIKVITKIDHKCDPKKVYKIGDLNYPSFSVPVISEGGGATTEWTYPRTLTNVGKPGDTYKVSVVIETDSVKAIVEPKELTFMATNEKKCYKVTFSGKLAPSHKTISGRLVWSDGQHTVASIIAFY